MTFVLSFIFLLLVSTSHMMIVFICTLILCSLGMSGNILILCILLQKHLRITFNKLRAALALFDAMVLGVMLLSQSILTFDKDLHGIVFSYFTWPVWEFSKAASMFMTVAIAIERLIAVTYPHNYRANRRYRATKYIMSVTIIALAFNLPKFNEYQPDTSCENLWCKNYGVTPTDLRRNLGYGIYEIIIFKLLVAKIIPITLLVCSYTKIFLTLRKNRKRMEIAENGKSPKEKKTSKQENMARLFAGVVITSLICNIPDVIFNISIITQYPDWYQKLHQWVVTVQKVRNFFMAINSAINIIIYSLLSKPFREECKRAVKRMISICICHKESSDGTNDQPQSVAKSNDTELQQQSED